MVMSEGMNEAFRSLALARAQAAIGAATAAVRVSHKGLKGHLRELLIKELLRPFLPADVGIGSGEIITAYGDRSSQQDIVIYDRRVAPPIVYEAGYGIFPVESVLFVIEVKSILDVTALRAADESARALCGFKYSPPHGGFPEGHQVEAVIPHLVAFSSDLSGPSETGRYDSMLNQRAPGLLGLCVVGKGFWFRADNKWNSWPMHHAGDELLNMTIGMVNTWARVAGTRLQPDLRGYAHP
jgi:hypothetical protein